MGIAQAEAALKKAATSAERFLFVFRTFEGVMRDAAFFRCATLFPLRLKK